MKSLLNRLNYKGNDNIVIFNIPEEFTDFEIKVYKNNTAVKNDFLLVFVRKN